MCQLGQGPVEQQLCERGASNVRHVSLRTHDTSGLVGDSYVVWRCESAYRLSEGHKVVKEAPDGSESRLEPVYNLQEPRKGFRATAAWSESISEHPTSSTCVRLLCGDAATSVAPVALPDPGVVQLGAGPEPAATKLSNTKAKLTLSKLAS